MESDPALLYLCFLHCRPSLVVDRIGFLLRQILDHSAVNVGFKPVRVVLKEMLKFVPNISMICTDFLQFWAPILGVRSASKAPRDCVWGVSRECLGSVLEPT